MSIVIRSELYALCNEKFDNQIISYFVNRYLAELSRIQDNLPQKLNTDY